MVINSGLLTERDCTREDVRVQARFELERANGDDMLAAWADKWGRALLTAADEASDDATSEVEGLKAELSQSEDSANTAYSELESELDDERKKTKRLSAAIAEAAKILDAA